MLASLRSSATSLATMLARLVRRLAGLVNSVMFSV